MGPGLMRFVNKYYIFCVLMLASCCKLSAQAIFDNSASATPSVSPDAGAFATTDTTRGKALFRVRKIIITGNSRTKPSIILRELPFKTNDAFQLQELVERFEDARRKLMNTGLFVQAVVSLKSFEGYDVDISVDVRERWYLYPIPYFKFVDRNFNQWWVEQKKNLSRVNYGLKVYYNNITGYNDKLNLLFSGGYTKQFSFNYDRLYFDKKMKWGLSAGFNVGKNREVNYTTVDNKQVFFKDPDHYIRTFTRANLELTYRRATNTRHRFGFAFNQEVVTDTIIKLNPQYFSNNHTSIRYPELYYNMSYFDVDFIPYPTRGYIADVTVGKKGFNRLTNLWYLNAKGSGIWPVGKKNFLNVTAAGFIKAPFKQPFYNQRLMGYGDLYLQGYEYYVIDGVGGAYIKTTFSRELFRTHIRVPVKQYKDVNFPFRVFGKIYGNTGYIYNPEPGINFLNNRLLFSTGLGVDIVTLYDFIIKLEWSFNAFGENGVYLHRKSYF